MIKSFVHRGLEDLFYDGSKRRVQPQHTAKLTLILDRLDAAGIVSDIDFPGSGLHPLKGKLKGFWAVKVSGNWRVIFRFEGGNAYEVSYVDYH